MNVKRPEALLSASYSAVVDKYFYRLLLLAALLIVFVLQFSGTVPIAKASPMTRNVPLTGYCNDPDPHCYAQWDWPASKPDATAGASTSINPYGGLSCPGCSGNTDFIDNEMWFADYHSSACVNDAFGLCWVEAGVSTYPGNDNYVCDSGVASICGFWAEGASGSGGYHEYPFYWFGPDGTDLSPYYLIVTIRNAYGNAGSGSTWNVSMQVYINSVYYTTVTGQSQSNPMYPSDIQIGDELSDTRGKASAGTIYDQDNQWLNTSGTWIYQSAPGYNNSTNAPPDGNWAELPNKYDGGEWHTWD